MKPRLIKPTPAEDARIAAGIASDPDTRELSTGEFVRLQSASVAHSDLVAAYQRRRGERGQQIKPLKKRVTIRLSADVVDRFRATGNGWQTRVDAALRDWLDHHPSE